MKKLVLMSMVLSAALALSATTLARGDMDSDDAMKAAPKASERNADNSKDKNASRDKAEQEGPHKTENQGNGEGLEWSRFNIAA
jgi:Ni/Co efflux regulator RcnB